MTWSTTRTHADAAAAAAASAHLPCPPAEVNACLSSPCTNGTGGIATCSDLPNPAPDSAAGRVCGCAKAESMYADDVSGCVDLNACTWWPCSQAGISGPATCADVNDAANSTDGE
jgi:hypothetical protein